MDRARRLVGTYRTVVATLGVRAAEAGPQAAAGPAGLAGHPVRAAYRDPVGVLAPGAGVRVRDDLLAASGRVERGRGVAAAARGACGRAERGREAGLVAGGDRQLAYACDAARPKSGPSPVDRARPGSKHHVIAEGGGIPMAFSLTGGNVNDITQLLPLVEAIPPVRGKRGRPRRRPDGLYADRAYDSAKHRDELRDIGITPQIAQRGTDHGSGLGVVRWVIERTMFRLV